MDIYKETSETWNKIASLYEEKFMDLDLYNETYDFFCDAINMDRANILEIGCGPGNITKYLLAKRPNWLIDGIDIAPNMIALAKKNNPSANFKVMDSRNINELPTTYDGIVCGFCLPYLSETDGAKLILDSHKLLSNNGMLYISFVEGDPTTSGFQVGSSGDRVYFHYHHLDDLTRQLVDHGFEKPQVFRVRYKKGTDHTDIHTITVTKKKTPASYAQTTLTG